MKTRIRFTFVCDRLNRTAMAALIASLEGWLEDFDRAVRFVGPTEALQIDFCDSVAGLEVLCMSSMSENAASTSRLQGLLHKRFGGQAFVSICGGPHSSGDPLSALNAGFDYCCVGEGEETIRDVARTITVGKAIEDVKGIYSFRDHQLKGERRHTSIDLDSYAPLPTSFSFPTYIEVGRGCRWACAYCQTPRILGDNERFRSPESVERIISVYAEFGMKDFRLLLPNALGYASGVPGHPNCEALQELLRRANLAARGGRIFFGSFPSEIRPDYVTERAVVILKKYVNNTRLVIGGQSGSQRILDLIGRGHTVENIGSACQIIASCGLVPTVDIMLGFPWEVADDRQATFDLIEDLGPAGALFNMHFFMPLPGTPLARSRPAFLSETEQRRLDRFAQRGLVRGRWRRQQELAKQWLSLREKTTPNG